MNRQGSGSGPRRRGGFAVARDGRRAESRRQPELEPALNRPMQIGMIRSLRRNAGNRQGKQCPRSVGDRPRAGSPARFDAAGGRGGSIAAAGAARSGVRAAGGRGRCRIAGAVEAEAFPAASGAAVLAPGSSAEPAGSIRRQQPLDCPRRQARCRRMMRQARSAWRFPGSFPADRMPRGPCCPPAPDDGSGAGLHAGIGPTLGNGHSQRNQQQRGQRQQPRQMLDASEGCRAADTGVSCAEMAAGVGKPYLRASPQEIARSTLPDVDNAAPATSPTSAARIFSSSSGNSGRKPRGSGGSSA